MDPINERKSGQMNHDYNFSGMTCFLTRPGISALKPELEQRPGVEARYLELRLGRGYVGLKSLNSRMIAETFCWKLARRKLKGKNVVHKNVEGAVACLLDLGVSLFSLVSG